MKDRFNSACVFVLVAGLSCLPLAARASLKSCADGKPVEPGLCAHASAEPLKGPVHTLHVERFSGRGDIQRVGVVDSTFDVQGNTTETVSCSRDGSVGQKLEWEYKYDSWGRPLEVRYLNSGQLTNTGVYTYTVGDERKVELVQINPGGSINHKAILLYDAAGNRVGESRAYPRNGTTFVIQRYDDNGHVVEWRSYNGAGVLSQRNVMKRDQFGNLLASDVYKSDGTSVEALHVNRNVQCNAHGNVIHAVNLNRDGSEKNTETISYDYDNHGNWTKKVTVREHSGIDVSTEIIERTITYY